MKPTRLSYTILIIIGIILIAVMAYFYNQGENKKESIDKKGENEKIEQSKYNGVDIITNTYEEDTYHKAIHYPKFEKELLNEDIKKYVSRMEQGFHDELSKYNKEALRERPAQLYLTFYIYPVIDQLYSIVFTEESYVGGANSRQSNTVFLVDLKNEQFIKQTEIINDTKENREKLYNLLLNAFKQSEEYSSFLVEEDLRDWIENKDNKFSNMYLTNQAIVFEFDKYEVTAGAAGMPVITLPFKQVSEIVSAEWLDRLKIEDTTNNNEPDESDESITEDKTNQEESTEEDMSTDPSSTEKRVALTFDDGPHPKNTLTILDLLAQHDAKATFFMLGSRVDFYPNIAKKVAEDGHEIGNHTWDHKDLTTLSPEKIIQEVQHTNEIILEATSYSATILRPPYGSTNKEVENSIDITSVLWTIDTLDWQSHDPEAVLEIVKENVKDGSIILMHDIHESTIKAVELVLNYLEENGYKCVTVSEIL
ncbi:peptidoglycan-N-acetylmuramic acid deacetylase PdaC [Lysinibacillus sp. PLM2]|nr:peptidoglycan-N-acetylmuramic acid deacetylase PdaC [Lysinibacillus sp. PLM2]